MQEVHFRGATHDFCRTLFTTEFCICISFPFPVNPLLTPCCHDLCSWSNKTPVSLQLDCVQILKERRDSSSHADWIEKLNAFNSLFGECAINPSAVAQHAQIEYKVSAGKDGDRLVKLISLRINSFDKCIWIHYNIMHLSKELLSCCNIYSHPFVA